MASYVLWIFLTLCPFLAHSESGDDASLEPSVFCFSTLSFKFQSLTCHLAEEDIDDFEYATLCDSSTNCLNGTLEKDSFSFHELAILKDYQLKTYFKEGSISYQNINLYRLVKIPTPAVDNATYSSEQAYISFIYHHDYVTDPMFQVEIWGKIATDKFMLTVMHKSMTIGGERLRDSDVYNVRVRAKPTEYFDGSWTEWSPVKSFRVIQHSPVRGHSAGDPGFVTYTILCTSLLLVIAIGLVTLRWKKEIQDYIFPSIPNPKATLAQIHREMEHPSRSFSAEIDNDIKFNRVDYAEEKLSSPRFDEGQEDSTGSCPREAVVSRCSSSVSLCEKQDGDDRNTEAELSHLKIRLLDQPEEGEDEVGCQSLATLQRDCRDETYVTMSSLYKTQ